MSNCIDITIDKGGSFRLPFQVLSISVDEDSGIESTVPIDIANAIIKVDFRDNDENLLVTYTTSNGGVIKSSEVIGQASLTISPQQTRDYLFTKAKFDVKITYEDTSVDYLFEGKVYVRKTTTD